MLVVIAGGVAVLVIGGNSRPQVAGASPVHGQYRATEVFSPPTPAPPLALRNYLGRPVNIDSYRGRAVLVTFLYTNCPDICPLITASLHATLELLGLAGFARADRRGLGRSPRRHPQGRRGLPRTPQNDRAHAISDRLRPRTRAGLEGMGGGLRTRRRSSRSSSTTPGLVYGISASGKRTTIYAANFIPAELAHDVPLLAAQ